MMMMIRGVLSKNLPLKKWGGREGKKMKDALERGETENVFCMCMAGIIESEQILKKKIHVSRFRSCVHRRTCGVIHACTSSSHRKLF